MSERRRPIRIAPSILSADFARLADEVARLEEAGCDWIHVDVMDGHFVPNLTIGPMVVAALRRVSSVPLDVHLMIAEPDRYVAAFCEAGADVLTFHIEAAPDPIRTCEAIRARGVRAGIALRPATRLDRCAQALAAADLVLVMTVEPGFGGQPFMAAMLDKVAEAAVRWGRQADVEVDGGIDAETVVRCAAAGANVFVAGSYVFGHRDPAAAIRALREGAQRGRSEALALEHSVDEVEQTGP
ncbi:MAG: ribulose-phosphate 3-epimerase [Planctomycetota bacterium]|nr:MAG: ribulose-phosphate 3-epimerase [Planctomycetota bacterium]